MAGLSVVAEKAADPGPPEGLGFARVRLPYSTPILSNLWGPPQVSLGHELSSFALGQEDDKTYSPWVSIAETLSHAGARERCRDPKTGGKLQSNPFGYC